MKREFQVSAPSASARAGDVEIGTNGEHEVYYASGERTLIFEREDFDDGKEYFGFDIFLPQEKWHWAPPHEKEEVPESMHTQILEDLSSAFAVLGEKISFRK